MTAPVPDEIAEAVDMFFDYVRGLSPAQRARMDEVLTAAARVTPAPWPPRFAGGIVRLIHAVDETPPVQLLAQRVGVLERRAARR